MHMDISCELCLSQVEVTVSTTSPFLYFNERLGFGFFFSRVKTGWCLLSRKDVRTIGKTFP